MVSTSCFTCNRWYHGSALAYNSGGNMSVGGRDYLDRSRKGLIGRRDHYIRSTVTRVENHHRIHPVEVEVAIMPVALEEVVQVVDVPIVPAEENYKF